MTEPNNLPAVRTEPGTVVVARDTDSWAAMLPDVVDLSRAIASTNFVPDGLRNDIAATTAAILYGREIGLPPMTALNSTHVIKGRVGLSAEIMRAQILAAGHEIIVVETTSARCVLRGRRSDSDRWTTVEYSIDDARTAGLLGNDNYKKNPRRMLQARASGELAALIFPDVVRGMSSKEELEELESDAPAETAAAARGKVQRKQRTSKTDDGAAPLPGTDSSPAAPSSPPLPPLPGEPGYDDMNPASTVGREDLGSAPGKASAPLEPAEHSPVDVAPDAEAVPVADRDATGGPAASASDPVKMNTRAQQRGLFALFKGLGIVDDAERMQVTADLIGRMPTHQGEPSWNGLTWDEASWMTTAMSSAKTRDHVEALIEIAQQERAAAGEQP